MTDYEYDDDYDDDWSAAESHTQARRHLQPDFAGCTSSCYTMRVV